jgi:hypothetical protein
LFYPDIDEALPVGIRAMTAVAIDLFGEPPMREDAENK